MTNRNVCLGVGVVALLQSIVVALQAMVLVNAGTMAGDVREIHADIAAIRDHDGVAATNRALAQLIEQSRVTERLLDRAR